MKFNVSYTSVVMVIAKDIDEAVSIVLNQLFDFTDSTPPVVLDVERVQDDEEDEDGDDGT